MSQTDDPGGWGPVQEQRLIIDILLVVADPADEAAYLPELERAGYRLVIREPGRHQHRVLKGPDTDVKLHVHPPGSPEIDRQLRFRDQLRASPADREIYERTKRRLAGENWTYIQQYADAKTGSSRRSWGGLSPAAGGYRPRPS
jgi:GrpB-like predicted nucleotidyltransferase (UPF0157 family)